MKKTSAFTLAVAVVLLLALGVAALVRCAAPAPPPNLGGLREILRRSAEKKISAAGLANEQLTLTAAADQIEVRAKEVIDAAIQAGGTAIKTSDPDGTAVVLAQIPALNVGLFHGLMKSGLALKQTFTASHDTQLIEVTIQAP